MTQQSYLESVNESNHQRLELLRNTILLQLEASRPETLPLSTISYGIKLAGFKNLTRACLLKELAYLLDKELIIKIEPNLVSPTIERYRLHAKGLDYLESQNLI